jgi:hypothetical protein
MESITGCLLRQFQTNIGIIPQRIPTIPAFGFMISPWTGQRVGGIGSAAPAHVLSYTLRHLPAVAGTEIQAAWDFSFMNAIGLKTILCCAATVPLLILSCSTGHDKPRVDVSLVNNTTQSFAWSEVCFGEQKIEFGIIGMGAGGGGKTYLNYSRPITTRAVVTLTDADHKIHEYNVSLVGVYDPKRAGTLTFEVTPRGVVPQFTPKESPGKE